MLSIGERPHQRGPQEDFVVFTLTLTSGFGMAMTDADRRVH